MSIVIRKATEQDQNAIFGFILEAFPKEGRHMVPDLWKWQFLRNPYRKKGEIPFWLAIDNSKIIGQIGAIPVRLKVDNAVYEANWGADLSVLPKYRGIGIGIKLLKVKNAYSLITMGGQMINVVKRLRLYIGDEIGVPAGIYAKSTCVTQDQVVKSINGKVPRNKVVQKVFNLLIKNRTLIKIMTYYFNKRIALLCVRKDPTLNSNYNFKKIENFDESVDKLWNRLSRQFDASVVRYKEYLNWKFCVHPNLRHENFYMYLNKNLIGYLVLRRETEEEGNGGLIIDFLVDINNENHIRALFYYAEYYLLKTNPDGIKCAASISEFQDALLSQGYNVIRKIYPLINVSDNKLRDVKEKLLNKFHLTFGDQDWDYYRPWQGKDNDLQ